MVQSTPTPSSIHPQTCPLCGLAPVSAVEHRNGNAVTLDYLCLNEHIWLVKFLAVA